MREESLFFDSRDGVSKVYARKWLPDEGAPIAILQITHGMAEHIERYKEFANYLTDRGIAVVGDDHLGHGKTAAKNGLKGYFCKNDPATVVVRDEHRLKKTIQQEYPGVPYFIMGHSMGSFIVRNYLCEYGSGVNGAIVMGTGMQPKALLYVSKFMAAINGLFKGERSVAMFINGVAFGAYNKNIPDQKTSFDWLSRNEENVSRYMEDPDCGFVFTVNGFKTLFELIMRLHDKSRVAKIPQELPILVTSGEADPVGEYGKAVKTVFSEYETLGIKDVTLKLYPEDRHEILNEVDRQQVFSDIFEWINARIKKEN